MTAKQSIAWLQAAWKDDKKRINLLLVSGLAGMLLLCMSEWLPAGQSTQNAAQSSQQSQTAAEYEQQLENRLAALIRAMDGAGETVVMVTLDCGEETTYAADTRTEKTSEDTRSSAASQRLQRFSKVIFTVITRRHYISRRPRVQERVFISISRAASAPSYFS